jgi:hypothetical protein
MLFSVLDHSNTPSVSTTSNHNYISNIEFDEINDLVFLKIQLDGVISPDDWVRVADSATIIGVQVWDTFLPKLHRTNLAELELQYTSHTRKTFKLKWQTKDLFTRL